MSANYIKTDASNMVSRYAETPRIAAIGRECTGELYIPLLSELCKKITAECDVCNEMKLTNVVKDGKIPSKENKLVKPWEVLSVDLCGPWKIKCIFEEAEKDAKKQTRAAIIWALTMIDEGSR